MQKAFYSPKAIIATVALNHCSKTICINRSPGSSSWFPSGFIHSNLVYILVVHTGPFSATVTGFQVTRTPNRSRASGWKSTSVVTGTLLLEKTHVCVFSQVKTDIMPSSDFPIPIEIDCITAF